MTIKELYEKAVEGGYENLPLYIRDYKGYTTDDTEIDAASIRIENDEVIFI